MRAIAPAPETDRPVAAGGAAPPPAGAAPPAATGSRLDLEARVERIAQSVAEQIDAQHRDQDGEAGERREPRSEEHTSELQSRGHLVCRLLLEKKKQFNNPIPSSYTKNNTNTI